MIVQNPEIGASVPALALSPAAIARPVHPCTMKRRGVQVRERGLACDIQSAPPAGVVSAARGDAADGRAHHDDDDQHGYQREHHAR